MSIEKLKKIIKESNNIVFLGGAGVSTESNIPDFRSTTGLYSDIGSFEYSPEIILSHSFFMKQTEDFYQFYRSKMIYQDAKPNDAHLVLTELEKIGKVQGIITQNIDGLHQRAGSKNVLELHGSIYRNYCMDCDEFFDLDYIIKSETIPLCDKFGGIVKPDVVLYEESLDKNVLNSALKYIQEADVLIIGGTSLTVYPAASLVEYYNGHKLILINKSQTQYDRRAAVTFNEPIGQVLKQAIQI